MTTQIPLTAMQIKSVVHGDVFLSEGSTEALAWPLDNQMKKHLEITTEVLGPSESNGEVQELRILNRVLSWEASGIKW